MSTLNYAGRISASEAQELIGTYQTEEGWQSDETRAVWFSRDNVADILELIDGSSGDGTRIYFGKYPSDAGSPIVPDPDYTGKVTLVFIPTIAKTDGQHQDLFPAVAVPADNAALARDGGPQAYNHGQLCPPNCSPMPPTP